MAVILHYELPDDLHRAAKTCAAAQGITLRAFVVNALMVACRPEAYHDANVGAVTPRDADP